MVDRSSSCTCAGRDAFLRYCVGELLVILVDPASVEKDELVKRFGLLDSRRGGTPLIRDNSEEPLHRVPVVWKFKTYVLTRKYAETGKRLVSRALQCNTCRASQYLKFAPNSVAKYGIDTLVAATNGWYGDALRWRICTTSITFLSKP